MIPIALALAAIVVVLAAAERLAFGKTGAPAPHLARGPWPDPASRDARRFALVLNGAWKPRKNHSRYWNNISLAVCALRSRGWGTVATLSAGGAAGAADRVMRSFLGTFAVGPLALSPPDLDGDGRPDVDGPASRETLRATLARIGSSMRTGDSLFIFMTDHGQWRVTGGRPRAVAVLWNGEMTGEEFDDLLREAIPASAWVAILAAQCHSLWFLREVRRPNTLLMASGRPLWIWSNQHYSVFPYHFFAALAGFDPVTRRPLAPEPEGSRTGATLREAFARARAADHAPEWPVAWATSDLSTAPGWF